MCHSGKEHFLWCSQSKAPRLYITARRMVNLTEGANVTVMKTLLSASIRIEIIAIAVANFFSPSRHLWATFWSCLLFVKWFLFIRRQNCYFSAWQSLILALVSFPSHSWPPWCSWLITLTSRFGRYVPNCTRLYPLLCVEHRFLHQLPWVWTDFSPCFWGWVPLQSWITSKPFNLWPPNLATFPKINLDWIIDSKLRKQANA